LAVTHGIFSNGLNTLHYNFADVFCSDSLSFTPDSGTDALPTYIPYTKE
jgi:hypothetical protein